MHYQRTKILAMKRPSESDVDEGTDFSEVITRLRRAYQTALAAQNRHPDADVHAPNFEERLRALILATNHDFYHTVQELASFKRWLSHNETPRGLMILAAVARRTRRQSCSRPRQLHTRGTYITRKIDGLLFLARPYPSRNESTCPVPSVL
ncbi:hypothetical protein EX30DRAFT_273854 [Ascodesmis nigricans]|uniref:Uncharacterized protein n=1 Tax=Ascodesmis nigricans TaxID=341454 RepID=A0A4V3SHG7_9PEZI|nr:hypothetical protein EX30DRAFT_273854 [Ascodesmis nigricans]